jgi:hypothetical protein
MNAPRKARGDRPENPGRSISHGGPSMPAIRRIVLATLLLTLLSPLTATAALILPDPGGAFPDLSAGLHGTINYAYDPATTTGQLEIDNAPYMFSLGDDQSLKFPVSADSNGVLSESLKLTLDSHGNILTSPNGETFSGSYDVYGSVKIDGQTYDGLLISGTPVSFGSQDLGSVGINGTDLFDFKILLSGGLLAKFFSASDYLRVQPLVESTFDGKFDRSFVGGVSHSYLNNSYATPEPATWMILIAGGAGLAWNRYRARAEA